MLLELGLKLVTVPLERVDVSELGLVSDGSDHGKALAVLECANYSRPDSVLLDHIGRVPRGLLETLLQILFRCLSLQVVKEISNHPIELRKVLSAICVII